MIVVYVLWVGTAVLLVAGVLAVNRPRGQRVVSDRELPVRSTVPPPPPPPRGGAGVARSDHGPAVVDRLVRERLVVTLKSGSAFSGVLYEADARYLALRGVVHYERTPEGGVVETPADGELFIAVTDVDYIQRP